MSGPSFSELPLLPDLYGSRAYDANESGQIVGAMTDDVQMGPFVFQNGSTLGLPLVADATEGEALGINAIGMICGYCNNGLTGPIRPTVWQDGQVTELTLSLGPGGVANDIDDSGQVCGWMGVAPYPGFLGHAFIWHNGATVDLGLPPGASNTEAKAINAQGNACGIYTVDDPKNRTFYRRGAVWINQTFVDPGMLPTCNEYFAYDINDANDVVGYCGGGVGYGGFLWHNGVMHKLTDLLLPGAGLKINTAWSINSLGQIACEAVDGNNDSVAVLLTPVPPAAGDVNCDWVVNIDDLLMVINGWGPCAKGSPCGADVDQSGAVNIDDLLIVINGWS